MADIFDSFDSTPKDDIFDRITPSKPGILSRIGKEITRTLTPPIPLIANPIKTLRSSLEAVRESKTTEREKLRGIIKPVLGDFAGEGAARGLSALRTMFGVPFSALAPEEVTKTLSSVLESVGKGAGKASRAVGIPEDISRLIEEVAPDVVALGLPFGARAIRGGIKGGIPKPAKIGARPTRTDPSRALPPEGAPPAGGVKNIDILPERNPATSLPKKDATSLPKKGDIFDQVTEGVKAELTKITSEAPVRKATSAELEALSSAKGKPTAEDFALLKTFKEVTGAKESGIVGSTARGGKIPGDLDIALDVELGPKGNVKVSTVNAVLNKLKEMGATEIDKTGLIVGQSRIQAKLPNGKKIDVIMRAPDPAKGEIIRPVEVSAELSPGDAAKLAEVRGRAELPPETPKTPEQTILIERAKGVNKNIIDSVEKIAKMNEAAKIVIPQAKQIARTGTLTKEVRESLREVRPIPQTRRFKFSEQDIIDSQRRIDKIGDEVVSALDAIKTQADPVSFDIASTLIKKANQAATEFKKFRRAASLGLSRFNKGLPPEILEAFKEIGIDIEHLSNRMTDRLPLYNSIGTKVRNWKTLNSVERGQLGRDLIDAFRLNLFSMGSFSLDVIGNSSEITGQLGGGLARDLVVLVKGNPTFPSMQSIFRTIRSKRLLPKEITTELGFSVGGEQIRQPRILGTGKPGVFTARKGIFSAGIDSMTSLPLYLKGVADSVGKRFSAQMILTRDALEAIGKQDLKGIARQEFMEKFMEKPPEATVNNAIIEGNKAGFNRALTKWEKNFAGSKTAQLLVAAFGRWPFQFTRHFTEMLGWNPTLFKKVLRGVATAEEVAGYLGKTATGFGGVLLIDKILFDNVDFNTMEYKHINGDRTRLSSRSPIPEVLFLLAVLKGDVDKATGALRFTSFPGAEVLTGGGGLLGSFIEQVILANKSGKLNPDGVKREIISSINRAIPGQAVLAGIKTIFDPVLREGVGANIPGASLLLPKRINPATGEPLAPRQRVAGVELPSIAGTPIPGARRLFDPVTALFSTFDLLIRRGRRLPIAGFPAVDVPPEIRREFEIELGKARQVLILPFAKNMLARIEKNPELLKDEKFVANTRKQIQNLDRVAARQAKARIDRKTNAPSRVPRGRTLRQRRGS